MSHADYSCCAEDHSRCLFLVRPIGGACTSENVFRHIWQCISKIGYIYVRDKGIGLWPKFIRQYTTENNKWGDFQVHRRLMGLICVGCYATEKDIVAIYNSYMYQKEQFRDTTFDSRLILVNFHTVCEADSHVDAETGEEASQVDVSSFLINAERLSQLLPNLTNEIVCVHDFNALHVQVIVPIREFLENIAWLLESRRLEKPQELALLRSETASNGKALQLLMAPFERRELVGFDTDTKQYKRRCVGRQRKHLGDYSLLCGMNNDAVLSYLTALDYLKPANDWLWVAAALEGLCSASVALHYPPPKKDESVGFGRSASTSTKRGVSTSRRGSQNLMSLDLADHGSSLSHGDAPAVALDASSLAQSLGTISNLHIEDVIHKYKEALRYYKKYGSANVIELEASIKACRVLILQKKKLEAASFLQKVLFVNLEVEADVSQRYDTIADMYNQIGFKRKAAFYKRMAANHSVKNSSRPKYDELYTYLMQSMVGFGLVGEPRRNVGWPSMQVALMQEVIFAARKRNRADLAARHILWLLNFMADHLEADDQDELRHNLSNLALSDGNTNFLQRALTGGKDIGKPLVLTSLPRLIRVELVQLSAHMRPVHSPKQSANQLLMAEANIKRESPFIYSPLTAKIAGREEVLWPVGYDVEVLLTFYNPLSSDLVVEDLKLHWLGDGEIDSFSSPLISIPPSKSADVPLQVKVAVKPRTIGKLKLVAYSVRVLGVLLERIPIAAQAFNSNGSCACIIPPCPVIFLQTVGLEIPDSFHEATDERIVHSAALRLYSGERRDFQLRLENVGSETVHDVEVQWKFADSLIRCPTFLTWKLEELAAQLPLRSRNCAILTLSADAAMLESTKYFADSAECLLTVRYRGEGSKDGIELESTSKSVLSDYYRYSVIVLVVEVALGVSLCASETNAVDSTLCFTVQNNALETAHVKLELPGAVLCQSDVASRARHTFQVNVVKCALALKSASELHVWLNCHAVLEWRLRNPATTHCGRLLISPPQKTLCWTESDLLALQVAGLMHWELEPNELLLERDAVDSWRLAAEGRVTCRNVGERAFCHASLALQVELLPEEEARVDKENVVPSICVFGQTQVVCDPTKGFFTGDALSLSFQVAVLACSKVELGRFAVGNLLLQLCLRSSENGDSNVELTRKWRLQAPPLLSDFT